MKKLMVWLLALLLVFPLLMVSVGESKNSDLVSYGITCSKGGQSVPVFDGIGSEKKTDLLPADQLCALDFSSLQGKYYWHHIVYLDDAGQPKDGYVKESNFIAQRAYSAPDQDTLNAYKEQLYNGKWYVDCSVGSGKGPDCQPVDGTGGVFSAVFGRALCKVYVCGCRNWRE